MKSNRLLILKLLLVTVAAAVTAHYVIETSMKMKSVVGLTDNGFSFVMRNKDDPHPTIITNNVDFINKSYRWHLISPTWMNIHDQMLIWNWIKIEKGTRLGIIVVLWLTGSSCIILRHFKNRKQP